MIIKVMEFLYRARDIDWEDQGFGSRQWLDNSSIVWVEYYGQVNDCDSIPYAKARFEQPTVDNGSSTPQNLTSDLGATCPNAQITLMENQGVAFETGNSLSNTK